MNIWERVRALFSSAQISLVDDSGPVQLVQIVLNGIEMQDQIPRLVEYGLASNPPVNSDALAVFLAGDRSAGAIVATGNQGARVRNLPSGAVALHDNLGQYIALLPMGIYVVCPAGMVLTGELTAAEVSDAIGSLAELRAEVAALRLAYDGHTHGSTPGGPSDGTPSLPV